MVLPNRSFQSRISGLAPQRSTIQVVRVTRKRGGTYRSEGTPGYLPSSSRMNYSPLSYHPGTAMSFEFKRHVLLRMMAPLIRISSKRPCPGGIFFFCSCSFFLFRECGFPIQRQKGLQRPRIKNGVLQVNSHGNLTKDANIGSNPFRRILYWRFDNTLKSRAHHSITSQHQEDHSCPEPNP